MLLALIKIFNSCFKICYFPTSRKKITIIMIPKPVKNHSEHANYNYRLIALLSSISKVYERIILEDLQLYLINQIRLKQSVRRNDHSTTQQLVSLADKISINMNNRKHIDAVFLDVEKVFELIWHEGLIFQMQQMNISLYLIKAIKAFLTNCTFFEKQKTSNLP